MILYELFQTEAHPTYQDLAISNGVRQYDFLRSVVLAAIAAQKLHLSQNVIKALNYQAITCLHTNAGEFRPCPVFVGKHVPPEHYRVQALMDDFVNDVNRNWDSIDGPVLAAWVLWRLNFIHPFINGNGRTARAASYFVLCLKSGGLLAGSPILPELITQNRVEYIAALEHATDTSQAGALADIGPLHAMLVRLLDQQVASAGVAPP